MKITHKFWKAFDKVLNLFTTFAIVLVIFDALAISLDVILRYLFNISQAPLFEIMEYSLLWMTFLATAGILRSNRHINLDLVVTHLTGVARVAVRTIAYTLSIALLATMIWYTTKITIYDFQMDIIRPSYLQPPKWILEIIIPIGFLLLLLQMLRNLYNELSKLRSVPPGREVSPGGAAGGEEN